MRFKKKIASLSIVLIVICCSISFVNAASWAQSALVTISSGGSQSIVMDDCPYNGHQGGVKPTKSFSGTSIKWELKKKTLGIYFTQANESLKNLSTSSWTWTDGYSYGTGDFKHIFTANGASYTGNIEGLNTTV